MADSGLGLHNRKGGQGVEEASEDVEPELKGKRAQHPGPGSGLRKGVLVLFACLGFVLYHQISVKTPVVEKWEAVPGFALEVPTFTADVEKQSAIIRAFKHAWHAYETDAMGHDEYHPITKKGSNLTEAGGIGYTIVDSIDTMQIMGLEEEYQRARRWIESSLDFDRDGNFNTFETTIRVLGGLLSAYYLSGGDSLYLERAVDLADRILPAFDTPSGLPRSSVNLALRKGVDDPSAPDVISTAEASTLQLELRYLSHLTDDDEYWDRAEGVMKVVKAARIPTGLAPIYMGAKSGQFLVSEIRLGSRGDSYYEYLLKQYLQTNRTEFVYREMYEDAMNAIHTSLIRKSIPNNFTYTAELLPLRPREGPVDWRLSPKQDHLVCFLGGSLMLGAVTTEATGPRVSVPPKASELTATGRRDWTTGYELIKTCVDTYKRSATGLSPEIVYFHVPEDEDGGRVPSDSRDWYIKGARPAGQPPPYDARYILRPETVESLFLAFRLTGDTRYRDYGWEIFQSIEKYCRIETGGYASILDVDDVNSKLEDKMETFLMSETLKYLYLLFSDDKVLPLNEYVFNTEAHPLPIFNPSTQTDFA